MKKLICILALSLVIGSLSAQSYEFNGQNYKVYEFFTTTDSLNGVDTVTCTLPGPLSVAWIIGVQTYSDTVGGHAGSVTYNLYQSNSYDADRYTLLQTWNTASNLDTVFTLGSTAFTGSYLKIEAINATAADSTIERGWVTLKKP